MWSTRCDCSLLICLLLAAAALRGGALWAFHDSLADDPDNYLAIAGHVADGEGFLAPGPQRPTAYRPPLYPLLLAGILKAGGCPVAVGLLQLLLGTATVWLTWLLGRRLGLSSRYAALAAGLVAVDPILIRHTAVLMTETLFTFLVTALLLCSVLSTSAESRSITHQLFIGTLFGLCALCRPTIWAFAGLAGVVWCFQTRRNRKSFLQSIPWAMLLAAIVVVSPWLIRNLVVFRRPIFTTTHGGYTLLLANNPVFYDEVVRKPPGTTWQQAPAGRTQADWIREIQTEIQRELGPNAPEPARDRWMYRRALANITAQPGLFLRSCLLRFIRFWNVIPQNVEAASISGGLKWLIGLYYGCMTVGLLLGVFTLATSSRSPKARLFRKSRASLSSTWLPLFLLIAAFTLVHTLYWSNMRMRAPLVPVISLVAAAGLGALRRRAAADADR